MKSWKQWFAPDRKETQLAESARKDLAELLYAKARIKRRIDQERAAWAAKAYEDDAEGSAPHEIAVRQLEVHREHLAETIVQTKYVLELAERERRESADQRLMRRVRAPAIAERQNKLEEQRMLRLAEAQLDAELSLGS